MGESGGRGGNDGSMTDDVLNWGEGRNTGLWGRVVGEGEMMAQ